VCGLIKVAEYAFHISVKIHVLMVNFRLLHLPYNSFSILLHGKLLRKMFIVSLQNFCGAAGSSLSKGWLAPDAA
jgi:hypothetical protein